MHARIPEPQEEPLPSLAVVEFTSIYEVKDSLGFFEMDKAIVENHFNALAIVISNNLTNQIGAQFSIGDIEYLEGSVVVNAKALAAWLFIVPIIQGYIVNQMPNINELFQNGTTNTVEANEKYGNTCKKIEEIIETTIYEYEKDKLIQSKKTTIKTLEINDVCNEMSQHQKP